jgi:hypothetical protein
MRCRAIPADLTTRQIEDGHASHEDIDLRELDGDPRGSWAAPLDDRG